METKLCRYCKEEIDATATRCKCCKWPQTYWMKVLPFLFPLIFIPLLLIPLLRTSAFKPTIEFNEVKQQFTVKNVKLKFEGPPELPPEIEAEIPLEFPRVSFSKYSSRSIWIYCTIKNDSDYSWEQLEFLAEFQDEKGKRLDLANLSERVTVQPHSELECRISCNLAIDAREVKKTIITVTDASRPYR